MAKAKVRIRKRTWKTADGEERQAWLLTYKKDGKRRFETFDKKKDAEDRGAIIIQELSLGTHTPLRDSKTVSEVWDMWIDHCRAEGLERGTLQQRQQHLILHVAPFIGQRKLAELTTPGMNEFMDVLRDSGRSASMRRKVLTNVSAVLKFAQGRSLVSQNVAQSAARIKNDGRDKAKLREGVDFPSRTEIKLLIDTAPKRWRPFFITAAFTGLRASELRGLPWNNVDLDKGVIHVRQRADKWGSLGPPKTKKGNRDIPLAPIVINALRQWKLVCPKGALNLVFPNDNGKPVLLQNFEKRVWSPLQLNCGLSVDTGEKDHDGKPILAHRYAFHMLRHAACSLFIAYLKWEPNKIQDVMGHSSIKMTFDLYGHLFGSVEADKAAMEAMEKAVTAA
jgi:integrase